MWPVMDFVALMGSVDARALNTVLMAIVSAANERGLELPASFGAALTLPGKAVTARLKGGFVSVGSPRYAAEQADLDDTVAAALEALEQHGKTVVVENKTGAGGAIGAAEAAAAAPDGHTLLFVASPFTTVAAAAKNPGYDPLRFVPVAPIAVGPLAFVVGKDVPANTMREFVELAKSMPGKLNYGSAGSGSVNHLALELLNARAGLVVVHVPYRGIADATKDLLGGSIQSMTAWPCSRNSSGLRCGGAMKSSGMTQLYGLPSRVDYLPLSSSLGTA